MVINNKTEKKSKEVAFKVDMEEDKEQEVEDTNENVANSIDLLEKRFDKVMRKLDKCLRNNVMPYMKGKIQDNSRGFHSQYIIKYGAL